MSVGYQVNRTLNSRQCKKLRKSIPKIDPARGWRLSKRGKKLKDFLAPSPKKTQPEPDGPNASGWYR